MKKMLRFLLSPLISLLILTPVTVVTTGCPSVASQVQTDGATIAQAVDNIAAIIQPSNPALAQNLETAAADLKAATANFTIGSATAVINDAAQALEVVLASIGPLCPVCSVVAPLIPIAVAAIDTLLASIGSTSTQPTQTVATRAIRNSAEGQANLAKVKGYKVQHHFAHSREADFKAAWNQAATTYPGLAAAALK